MRMADLAPVYPGCEEIGGKKDAIYCLDEKITTFFAEHLNLSKDKTYRFIIHLKIDKAGCVTETRVKAKNSMIEKEAIRVAKLLPQMKPAKHQGKNIGVMYSLILE